MHTLSDLRLLKVQGVYAEYARKMFNKYYYRNNQYSFIRTSRNPLLDKFVKLIFLDRSGFVFGLGNSPAGNVIMANALTRYPQPSYFDEGSYFCVISTAEERPYLTVNGQHYTFPAFFEISCWAIAHEIGHLLTLRQRATETFNSGLLDMYGHLDNDSALLTNGRPSFGLSSVIGHANEIRAVIMSTRLSVKQQEGLCN